MSAVVTNPNRAWGGKDFLTLRTVFLATPQALLRSVNGTTRVRDESVPKLHRVCGATLAEAAGIGRRGARARARGRCHLVDDDLGRRREHLVDRVLVVGVPG